jgi:hypothetical protein
MKQFDSFMLIQLATHGAMYYDFLSLPTRLVLLFVLKKSFTFYPFQVQAMDDFLSLPTVLSSCDIGKYTWSPRAHSTCYFLSHYGWPAHQRFYASGGPAEALGDSKTCNAGKAWGCILGMHAGDVYRDPKAES